MRVCVCVCARVTVRARACARARTHRRVDPEAPPVAARVALREASDRVHLPQVDVRRGLLRNAPD